MEWCVVHLNEDIGQDELEPQGERHILSIGTFGCQIECQFLLLNYIEVENVSAQLATFQSSHSSFLDRTFVSVDN